MYPQLPRINSKRSIRLISDRTRFAAQKKQRRGTVQEDAIPNWDLVMDHDPLKGLVQVHAQVARRSARPLSRFTERRQDR